MPDYIDELAYFLDGRIPPDYTKRQLDEILVAGALKLEVLKGSDVYSIPWIKSAIDLLTDEGVYRSTVPKNHLPEKGGATQGVHTISTGITDVEFRQLVDWKVLRERVFLSEGKSATLFKVPKGESMARLIVDAQKANVRANVPPTFSLARCEELKRRIAQLGPAWFVAADLRHWFYQIPIEEFMASEMNVVVKSRKRHGGRAGDKDLLLKAVLAVLPMGHSWSPFLAQSLCWALVLMDLDPSIDGFTVSIPATDVTPTFIEFFAEDGSVAGFITVYYDNVLIVCKDRNHALRWVDRLETASEKTGARWKEVKGKRVEGPCREVAFVGVTFKWEASMPRPSGSSGEGALPSDKVNSPSSEFCLSWWWPDEEREAFRKEQEALGDAWTPRRVASVFGTLMWLARIHDDPLCYYPGMMLEIPVLQKFVEQTNWDYVLSQEDLLSLGWDTLLQQVMQQILTPRVSVQKEELAQRKVQFAATDASTTIGLGVVWLSEQGTVIGIWHRGHDFEELGKQNRQRFASWVEIEAIYEAVRRCEESGILIRIATDNTAAIQAVLKGWSKSPTMQVFVRLIYDLLRQRNQRLSLVHVPGKNNVADAPSRNLTAEGAVAAGLHRSVEEFNADQERRRGETVKVLLGEVEAKWECINKGW